MEARDLNAGSVKDAHLLITPSLKRTPVLTCPNLSQYASGILQARSLSKDSAPNIKLFFKCENMQKSGSFKIRGALHKLKVLSDVNLQKGVIAEGAGNHCVGLAKASKIVANDKGFQIPSFAIVPSLCMPSKFMAMREYGADIVIAGSSARERQEKVWEVQDATGAIVISLTDPDVILGQGTVMLEFIQQMSSMGEGSLTSVIVPCGSGSLLAGTAIMCKKTRLRLFGSKPQEGEADEITRSLAGEGRIGAIHSVEITDELHSQVWGRREDLVRNNEYAEGIYAASEAQIKEAMKLILEWIGVTIEPSAALPLAVLLFNGEFQDAYLKGSRNQEENIGIILSGGNTAIESVLDVFTT